MKYIRLLLVQLALIVSVLCMPGFAALAEEQPAQPQVKFGFLTFGDAFWFASHHNANINDRTGLWFRRIYLTFDSTYDIFDARLRLEMSSPDALPTAAAAANMAPFVKDAYLGIKYVSDHKVVIGLSASPTWEVLESLWGYRPVEKTPLDMQRMGVSRDIGLAFLGSFSEKQIRYHVMFGNGADVNSEINRGKKIMLSLGFQPIDIFFLELYGDYEKTSGADRWTAQVFAFLGKKDEDRLGINYSHHRNTTNQDLRIASLFGALKIGEISDKKFTFLARFDRMFDANPAAGAIPYWRLATNAPINLLIAGIDVTLAKNIKLIPNIEYVFYDSATGGAATPGSVVIPRVTFFYQF